MHRSTTITLTLAFTLACGRPAPEAPATTTTTAATTASTTAATTASTSADDEALHTAARAYVARESAYPTITIVSSRVDGDHARLFIEPVGVEGDPAIVFMKRVNGQWQGLSLGTGYAPDDLRALGIPQSLWSD